jgi:hypothetical protein
MAKGYVQQWVHLRTLAVKQLNPQCWRSSHDVQIDGYFNLFQQKWICSEDSDTFLCWHSPQMNWFHISSSVHCAAFADPQWMHRSFQHSTVGCFSCLYNHWRGPVLRRKKKLFNACAPSCTERRKLIEVLDFCSCIPFLQPIRCLKPVPPYFHCCDSRKLSTDEPHCYYSQVSNWHISNFIDFSRIRLHWLFSGQL